MGHQRDGARALAFAIDVQRRIEILRPRQALSVTFAAAACATIVKLVLAWTSPGFFSGDDVEVQEMWLGTLWGTGWPIWDLQTALFPLGVVFPVQKLFALAGANDPATGVARGRASPSASTGRSWISIRIALGIRTISGKRSHRMPRSSSTTAALIGMDPRRGCIRGVTSGVASRSGDRDISSGGRRPGSRRQRRRCRCRLPRAQRARHRAAVNGRPPAATA